MTLQVIDNAVQLLRHLRPAVNRIRARDKRLAAQIVDAANSVVLNLGEAEHSDAGNKRARLHTAAGSASEVRAGIRAAAAWGYVRPGQVEAALGELDIVLAVIWKLTH